MLSHNWVSITKVNGKYWSTYRYWTKCLQCLVIQRIAGRLKRGSDVINVLQPDREFCTLAVEYTSRPSSEPGFQRNMFAQAVNGFSKLGACGQISCESLPHLTLR